MRARGETAGSPAIDADGPTAVIPAVVFSAIGARTPPTWRELIGEVGRSDPILGDVLREQNAGHPQLAPNPDGGNAVSTPPVSRKMRANRCAVVLPTPRQSPALGTESVCGNRPMGLVTSCHPPRQAVLKRAVRVPRTGRHGAIRSGTRRYDTAGPM